MFFLRPWSSFVFPCGMISKRFLNEFGYRVSVGTRLICKQRNNEWSLVSGFLCLTFSKKGRGCERRFLALHGRVFKRKLRDRLDWTASFKTHTLAHTAEICTHTWRQNQHTRLARIEVGVAWFWDVSKTVQCRHVSENQISQTKLTPTLSEFASSWIRHFVLVGCVILELL